MISKNKIKLLRSLKIKKYRSNHMRAILEGKRLIEESINNKTNIEGVWFIEDTINLKSNNNLLNKIKKMNIPYDIITKDDFFNYFRYKKFTGNNCRG